LNIKDLYALTMFNNLDTDKDFLDLMASTAGAPPSWADMLFIKELEPGRSEIFAYAVVEGPVYLICWSKPPDLPIGNAGPITVQESP
jgi:hypothetical protein